MSSPSIKIHPDPRRLGPSRCAPACENSKKTCPDKDLEPLSLGLSPQPAPTPMQKERTLLQYDIAPAHPEVYKFHP